MRQLTLDEIIDRYEVALSKADWRSVDVRQFTPSAASDAYWPALVELLRIRMEHSFAVNQFFGVAECVREFPGLLKQTPILSELAYEEYRLRQTAGQSVTADEFQERWQVDVSNWKRIAPVRDDSSLNRSRGSANTSKQAVGNISLKPGELFGPFRILCLLGRGALAKVYLAQQLDLSERAVVLKVCAHATLEPQKIALLQHPHIVQIFSVHEVSGYQVLCMPYAGATTLADLLDKHTNRTDAQAQVGRAVDATSTRTSHTLVTTLSNRQREVQTLVDHSQQLANAKASLQLNHGLSWPQRWQAMRYEDIVSELLLQLAQGLAHAHHVGIVHSDLKPANILIGDDGLARLVDFNVAQKSGEENRSLLGGTLPYMAPEHLRSVRQDQWSAGPASDLYSLGVIAFQLLSGHLPYRIPAGSLNELLDTSITDRVEGRMAYRLTAHDASCDLRSIIEKLLQPQLSQRYTSAGELVEDLSRHVHNRPLKFAANRSWAQRLIKWTARHPRLSSSTSVAAVATLCLAMMGGAAGYYRAQSHTTQAAQLVSRFEAELPSALVTSASFKNYDGLAESVSDSLKSVLATVRDNTSDQPLAAVAYLAPQQRTRIAYGLRTLERSLTLSPLANDQPLSIELVSLGKESARLAGQLDPSLDAEAKVAAAVDSDFRDLRAAVDAYSLHDYSLAIDLLSALIERAPQHHAAWLLLGSSYHHQSQLELADAAYARSLALLPNQWQAWYYRGQMMHSSALKSKRLDQFQSAHTYFTQALKLRAELSEALFNRALCAESLGQLDSALADAAELVRRSKLLIRAHLLSARVYKRQGNIELADKHTEQALASTPESASDYVYLGTLELKKPERAMAHFEKAHALDATDVEALQSLAYLQMEVNNHSSALKWLDLWVAAQPRQAYPLASRAVYRARQGDTVGAAADCEAALQLGVSPREKVQLASALVLMSEKRADDQTKQADRRRALSLLAEAVQSDWKLIAEISGDADMLALHADSRYQQLVKTTTAFGKLPQAIENNAISRP